MTPLRACAAAATPQPSEPLSPMAGAEGGRGGGFAEDLLARMERSIATTGGSIDQLKVRWPLLLREP